MRLKSYVNGFEVNFPASKWQRSAIRQTYQSMRRAGMTRQEGRLNVVFMLQMFDRDCELRAVGQ